MGGRETPMALLGALAIVEVLPKACGLCAQEAEETPFHHKPSGAPQGA
jgi:hypothetical protein